ncbi:DUF2690 domain-containing protein [Streptomyces sp. NPDC086147]|uniref:DUF2690 domain-containing protein n=1 Tax=Streptomyces sp. NPDC086147 TaxID=3155295 RepID=UPI00344E4616
MGARRPLPRGAVLALAEATGADPSDLTIRWERTRGRHGVVRGGGSGSGASGGGASEVPAPAPRSAAPEGEHRSPVPEGEHRVAAPEGEHRSPVPEGEHRVPAPEDETHVPAPVPPPPPGHGTRTRRATVLLHAAGILGALLVVTAALLLVDLGGGDAPDGTADGRATAPPTTPTPSPPPRTALPAGVKCSRADCAGRDPEAMGCGGPLAVTVARARVGAAGVEVRHSAACSASWARITGAAPGDTVSVEVAGATERATVPEDADTAATGTDAYTLMLALVPGTAARACGTLADGAGACTAGL